MGMNGKHCLLAKCHEFKKCAQDLEEIFEGMSCLTYFSQISVFTHFSYIRELQF